MSATTIEKAETQAATALREEQRELTPGEQRIVDRALKLQAASEALREFDVELSIGVGYISRHVRIVDNDFTAGEVAEMIRDGETDVPDLSVSSGSICRRDVSGKMILIAEWYTDDEVDPYVDDFVISGTDEDGIEIEL